ncbi:hypothetical protein MUP59_07295, partial [Candidatus Bathyarchaeota archaeon]|nr:hypothetical protein [Candidatus Bathyarchaeota archaeon]
MTPLPKVDVRERITFMERLVASWFYGDFRSEIACCSLALEFSLKLSISFDVWAKASLICCAYGLHF